jgi:hypothetical protein
MVSNFLVYYYYYYYYYYFMYFVTFLAPRFYILLLQLLHGASFACLVIQPCLSQCDTFIPQNANAFWTEN